MSLMKSIFGGDAAKSDAASDLFHSPVIPKVTPAKKKKSATAGATNNKQEETENQENQEKKKDDEPEIEADQQSSSEEEHKSVDKQEEEERTIFVGNLPSDISRKALANIFKECGKVASSRLRSVAVAGVKLPPEQVGNQNLMRKVCANTNKLLADTPKKSAQGYVVFQSVDSVPAALQMNNAQYQSHTIRVDRATPTVDSNRSVFVGNLPYGADEESLRIHFLTGLKSEEEDGVITGVRIVRDRETQKCKGFGYVTFSDVGVVPAALELQNSIYMKREIRVMVCGKRFGGKRGGGGGEEKRSFEGQRATSTTEKKKSGKRKSDGEAAPSSGGGKAKRRKARSEKKAPTKSGLSKRAATERKVDRRVKKLEKRAVRGMGKKKH